MTHERRPITAIALCLAIQLVACGGPALAEGDGALPEARARDLAAEVLRRGGSGGEDGLGAWTRSIVERALERAGKNARGAAEDGASPAPLPAERHADETARGLAARAGGAEVMVFMSLSVPARSWREWAGEAARIGAPLVLRGVAAGSLRETVQEIGARLGGHDAGVAIDPRLFRLFGVGRVPAVAVVPGGVPPCRSRGCADDAPPPHDLVAGNIGLAAALEAVASEGSAGRALARREFGRLRGER